jgi:hypothetical protein
MEMLFGMPLAVSPSTSPLWSEVLGYSSMYRNSAASCGSRHCGSSYFDYCLVYLKYYYYKLQILW